jgi:hypothetical protein
LTFFFTFAFFLFFSFINHVQLEKREQLVKTRSIANNLSLDRGSFSHETNFLLFLLFFWQALVWSRQQRKQMKRGKEDKQH